MTPNEEVIITALTDFEIDNTSYQAGNKYKVPSENVDQLVAEGKAEIFVEPQPETPAPETTPDIVEETPAPSTEEQPQVETQPEPAPEVTAEEAKPWAGNHVVGE